MTKLRHQQMRFIDHSEHCSSVRKILDRSLLHEKISRSHKNDNPIILKLCKHKRELHFGHVECAINFFNQFERKALTKSFLCNYMPRSNLFRIKSLSSVIMYFLFPLQIRNTSDLFLMSYAHPCVWEFS